MSRPITRRLTVVGTAAACLASAAIPAFAADFPVTITTTGGTRQFNVYDMAGDPLERLDFGANRTMAYRVEVDDDAVPLSNNDYSVTTSLSNLYYQIPGATPGTFTGTDHATMIPSGSLSLDYATNPLAAAGLELPVIPEFALEGVLSCDGLTVDPLDLLSLLNVVCPLIDSLTGTLALPVAGDAELLDSLDLTTALDILDLDLSSLPLSLTGAQERGRFLVPASAGAGDPVTGTGATVKQIMSGTNLLGSLTEGDALDLVQTALEAALAGLPVLPTNGATDSLLTLDQVFAALSAASPLLATVVGTLRLLPLDQVLSILGGLTAVLEPVLGGQLSSLTGLYSAHPVLTAQPSTTKPGTYAGTMTVDFFQP